MLHKLRFVIIGALMVIASAGASYAAVSAAMPSALLAAGTTRYATAYATGNSGINALNGWVDMAGMTKYISIPGGKTADVIVIFCGNVSADSGALVHVRALIRGAAASPTQFDLTNVYPGRSSSCAIFEKSNVTAGSPAVQIQWEVDGLIIDGATVNTRHMFVIANIH